MAPLYTRMSLTNYITITAKEMPLPGFSGRAIEICAHISEMSTENGIDAR
jgi:hypothetical protein